MKDIYLYNYNSPEGELVRLLIQSKDNNAVLKKDLPTNSVLTKAPIIQDRDILITGLYPIIEYLEERYPEPRLFPLATPEDRARMRMLLDELLTNLFTNPENTPEIDWVQLMPAHGEFLLGTKRSILDLVIAATSPDDIEEFNAHRRQVLVSIH